MKEIMTLLICLSIFSGCEDEPMINSSPIDLTSCFSPEFGTTETEQFLFNIQFGKLNVNLDSNITGQNLGYSIQEGSKIVFIYRHFLENNFNIDDDEVEIRILFEIDDNLDSFDISSIENFKKSNCIYSECGIALQTITGNLNGSKNSDGNWLVNATIKIQRFNQEKMVTINEIFKF